MPHYADIYVIKKTRSKKLGLEFLNHFLPFRKESTGEYLIPQYSNNPINEFDNALSVMEFLEFNENYTQSIYWRNLEEESPNAHGMIFYTEDGYMIFGISRDSDEVLTNRKAEACLSSMKEFFGTKQGYITHECPPEDTYEEFLKKVKK